MANISAWNKQKLIQFVEDNIEIPNSEAGCITFLFTDDGTLGWLNATGRAVVFSNELVAGSGDIDGISVSGSSASLPATVPAGELFEVSAYGVSEEEGPFYASYKVS